MNTLTDDVRALFEGANYAHVATVMPDGAPHSPPIWVGIDDGRVAFMTSPSSRKARNLDRDPRLSLSITKAEQPTTMAQVRGRVAERLEGERGVGGDRPALAQVPRRAVPVAGGPRRVPRRP